MVDKLCYTPHRCVACFELCLCDAFKSQCPWRLAEVDGIDGTLAGCMCLRCMNEVMESLQTWATLEGKDLEDEAADDQC